MTQAAPASASRRYRGSSASERRAERHARLLEAAVQVYGERGYRSATVKAVCEAAGLTERYFYESFANSEALMIACFRAVSHSIGEEMDQVSAAAAGDPEARLGAMLRAYLEILRNDPRGARVFLVEITGISPELDRAFDEVLDDVGRRLARTVGRDETEDALFRSGVVGGMIHLARRWVASDYAEPLDRVTAAAVRLCLAFAPAHAE